MPKSSIATFTPKARMPSMVSLAFSSSNPRSVSSMMIHDGGRPVSCSSLSASARPDPDLTSLAEMFNET